MDGCNIMAPTDLLPISDLSIFASLVSPAQRALSLGDDWMGGGEEEVWVGLSFTACYYTIRTCKKENPKGEQGKQ